MRKCKESTVKMKKNKSINQQKLNELNKFFKLDSLGNSLAVQQLGFCTSTAGRTGSIPGLGHLRSRMLCGKKKKKN